MALPQSDPTNQNKENLQQRPLNLRLNQPLIPTKLVPFQRLLQHVGNLRNNLPIHEPPTKQNLRQNILLPALVQHLQIRLPVVSDGVADIFWVVVHIFFPAETYYYGDSDGCGQCASACYAIWSLFVFIDFDIE